MKVTRLEIHNLGIVSDIEVEINKPMVLFFGDIRQGKSTILNAVKWCFGGSYPDDIIRHGESEAWVKLHIEGGSIRRSWYRSADGATKARDIELVIAGEVKKRPVEYLKTLVNPFLLD